MNLVFHFLLRVIRKVRRESAYLYAFGVYSWVRHLLNPQFLPIGFSWWKWIREGANSLPYARSGVHAVLNHAKSIQIVLHFQLGGGATSYLAKLVRETARDTVFLVVKPIQARFVLEVAALTGGANYNRPQLIWYIPDLSFFADLPKHKVHGLVLNELVFWGNFWGEARMSDRTLSRLIDAILKLRDALDCQMTYLVHDYLALCPHYTLLTPRYEFCGGEFDEKKCVACLADGVGECSTFPARTDIVHWRSEFARLFAKASEVRTFSEDAFERMKRMFPKARLTCVPHQALGGFSRVPRLAKSPLTIGVFGEISKTKGGDKVVELARYLKSIGRDDVKIVVSGVMAVAYDGCENIIPIGRYERILLPDIIEQYGINVAFFPSVWPETFSYVVQELMSLGLPLVCYNIGAPKDRVRAYDRGKVVDDMKPATVWAALQAVSGAR